MARWIAARPFGARVVRLAQGDVSARVIANSGELRDPYPVRAEVRIGSLAIGVDGTSRGVRALVQRVIGGPVELDAPRPPTPVETAIWTMALASALADWDTETIGLAVDAWPVDERGEPDGPDDDRLVIELAVDLPGIALGVVARVPRELATRVPPAYPPHPWVFAWPVVVARCALPRSAIEALAVRDVVIVEWEVSLVVGDGVVGLDARAGAVEATVTTGYVRRDMALPDDAHAELTVQLGTTRLSLRELGELAIGQVVPLGRPLSGPYEIHALGRLIGKGELVDVDGELGVRIVALAKE